MNRKQRLIDIGLIVVIIVMGVFVVNELNRTFDFMRQRSDSKPTQTPVHPIQVNASIPFGNDSADDLNQAQTEPFQLLDLDGKRVALSDYEGLPVLVNFWATWCPPCLAEMPLIQTFAEKHADDLVVLVINVGEEEILVYQFIDQYVVDRPFYNKLVKSLLKRNPDRRPELIDVAARWDLFSQCLQRVKRSPGRLVQDVFRVAANFIGVNT